MEHRIKAKRGDLEAGEHAPWPQLMPWLQAREHQLHRRLHQRYLEGDWVRNRHRLHGTSTSGRTKLARSDQAFGRTST